MMQLPNSISAPSTVSPYFPKGLHFPGTLQKPVLMTNGTAEPSSLTWEQGAIVFKRNAASGGKIGWVCTVAGTKGTLNSGATTGDITTGTATLEVNSSSGLALWQYITIAGVSGVKKIIARSGTTVTLDSNADATVTGAAVAFSPAVFKTWGLID